MYTPSRALSEKDIASDTASFLFKDLTDSAMVQSTIAFTISVSASELTSILSL